MNLHLVASLVLIVPTLSSCSSMDMDAMDETFHNTPEKQAAMAKAADARQQERDFYDDKSPYDYYRNQGFSEAQAKNFANADAAWGQPWRPSNYSQ